MSSTRLHSLYVSSNFKPNMAAHVSLPCTAGSSLHTFLTVKIHQQKHFSRFCYELLNIWGIPRWRTKLCKWATLVKPELSPPKPRGTPRERERDRKHPILLICAWQEEAVVLKWWDPGGQKKKLKCNNRADRAEVEFRKTLRKSPAAKTRGAAARSRWVGPDNQSREMRRVLRRYSKTAPERPETSLMDGSARRAALLRERRESRAAGGQKYGATKGYLNASGWNWTLFLLMITQSISSSLICYWFLSLTACWVNIPQPGNYLIHHFLSLSLSFYLLIAGISHLKR